MSRNWSLIILLLIPWAWTWAMQPYEPVIEASIEDQWRWAKLEVVSNLGYDRAIEGVGGVIWFSKAGEIARYDGIALTRYYLDEKEEFNGFHLSDDGSLLVLVGDRFCRFESGQLETLFVLEDRGNRDAIICESNDGTIWIGLYSKIYQFSKGSFKVHENAFGLIFSMVLDNNEMLWVSHEGDSRICVYDTHGSENQIDLVHQFDETGKSPFTRLALDSDGRVWILNPDEQGRLFLYDNFEKQVAVEGLEGPFWYTHNLLMNEFPKGRYWLSVPRRLAFFDGGSLTTFGILDFPLPTSNYYALILSNRQLLLGGRESETYLVDLSFDRWASYEGLNFQCEDPERNYWFLDHEGHLISVVDGERNWRLYSEEDGLIDTPNRAFCSSDGTLWISGKHGGVAAISVMENGALRRTTYPDLGNIFSHLAVLEMSDGSVIFGGGSELGSLKDQSGGAVVFRKEGGSYRDVYVAPPLFPSRPAIIVERQGEGLWFAGDNVSRSGGKGSLAPEVVDIYGGSRWTDHMVVDATNRLWLASWGKGIYELNGDDRLLHDELSGLASNQVINLLASNDGWSIWAATGEGLSHYDGRSWSNWSFSGREQFKREACTLYDSLDGSLWMNYAYRIWYLLGSRDESQRGAFRSVRYRKEMHAPVVEVTEFEEALPEGSPVLVRWKGQDTWSATPVEELEYSWRLDGGDWSSFSRSNNVALPDVNSGEHVFEVRVRDRDWNISENPARVTIAVIPPLWKRPWFIAAILFTVIVICYLMYALFKVRIRSAIAMEQFKLDFFTNISHELKNPLAVIVGPLESSLRDEQSQKTRRNLKIALRNARKMQGLVGQLLQFRKLELGKASYRPSHGEIVGFLRETVDTHAPLWKEKEQTVVIETNPNYCECGFDADKLQKIIDNLHSNGIKYSPDRSEILVRLNVSSKGGDREATLIVEDQGIGIPQHEIDLVLKPFYRVGNSKDLQEGFGIGLALVGQLVQLWGGEISLQSPVTKDGKGTRATVHLPLLDVSIEQPEPLSPEDSESTEHPFELGNSDRPQILLVEDNEDLRLFMKEELSEEYDILEAKNGEEGLAIARKADPDLVISDVMMPKMDGFELCRSLRAESETSHIPIIILTAKSSEEDSVVGTEAGADAYFAKPLNMLRLLAQIENVLEMRRRLKLKFSEQLVIEPTELTVSSTDEAILRKAIEIVEKNMGDEEFDVEHFAHEMAMSRATLYRKLKALTGQAPNPFIRSMRLKRAAQLLSGGELTVSETLEHVGILDLSYFSRVFKKEFGVSPSQYSASNANAE